MALHRYGITRQFSNTHSVARSALTTPLSDGAKAVHDITLTDNPAAGDVILFGGVTWTFVASGASGRQVNRDSTAALTAVAFVTAFNLHADGATLVASNPSGAIIRFTPVADSATIAGTPIVQANNKAVLTFTLSSTPSAAETIIFGGLTWTFRASGASGREVNIAGSAALTAAAFVTAFNLHADGATYVASNPSGADVKLVPVADSATISLASSNGTCAHSWSLSSTFNTALADVTVVSRSGLNTTYPVVPSGAGLALVLDDAVITTMYQLDQALAAVGRVILFDKSAVTAPASLPTSGTKVD